MNRARVLKEVQVPPCLLLEVMGGAGLATRKTRILRAPFCLHFKMTLVGCLVGIQPLINQLPGRLDTQTQ